MKVRWLTLVGLLTIAVLSGLSGCDWFMPPVTPPPPALGFAPVAGAVHTLVTVVGQGFGSSMGDGGVTFDGVAATIETWSDTNIVAHVPVLSTSSGQRVAAVEVRRSGMLLGAGAFTVLRGILFESYRDGNSEVYVMNPDGTQETNLTNDPDSDDSPVWSPDGTKIAFESTRDGNREIYVMDADGSDPTNLTNHPEADYFPAWSPDGEKIAFMTDREVSGPVVLGATAKITIAFDVEIFSMNDDGTGQTNLTDDSAWDGYPSWSPDGERIVFQTNRDNGGIHIEILPPDGLGYEVYAMDADGSDPVRLSNSPGDDICPRWSPDGLKIAFESYRDGNPEIYAMNADGTGQVRLTDDPGADSSPTWSPTGSWLTFHSNRDGNAEIYKMTAAGGSTTRLTNASSWDWGPSWSVDGQEIVFQSARDGNPEIYRMDADGSSQERLTTEADADVHPFWGTFGWTPPA
jgi:Tol biopolymer transport system component